jgi:hypothetical protein
VARHIQNRRTGRLAGSIGEGKYKIPMPAPEAAWVRLPMTHPLNVIVGKLIQEVWVGETTFTVVTDSGTYVYSTGDGARIAGISESHLLTKGQPIAGFEFTPGVGYRIATYMPLYGKVWSTVLIAGDKQAALFANVESGEVLPDQNRVDNVKKRRRTLLDFFSYP